MGAAPFILSYGKAGTRRLSRRDQTFNGIEVPKLQIDVLWDFAKHFGKSQRTAIYIFRHPNPLEKSAHSNFLVYPTAPFLSWFTTDQQ